jgi:crossover junction endodeoxyribonuclease RuvC
MRVLGIDPGSRYCGFGIVEDAGGTRVRHLGHGVLALGDARPIEDRLRELHEGLSRQILEHRPDMVAVEDVFHAKNARSALVLGQARGVALLAAAQSGAKVRSFPPSVIKMAVTGSGRAEKEQVGRMVSVLLGVSIEGRLDASDALAAAICCVLRRNVELTVEVASDRQDGEAPPRRGDWRAALARKVGR